MAGPIKNITAFCFVCIFIFPAGFVFAQDQLRQGYEPMSFFNNRLRVTGVWDTETKFRLHLLKHKSGTHAAERHARKSNLSMIRSNWSLEAVWMAIRKPDWEINVISHWYYSYDFTGHFDSEFKRGIPNRSYHQYIRTEDEDLIRELYVQFIKGDWDIRIGKQQVVWGQQLGKRTLDVVNPLDLRTQVIGLTEWENVRIGLWMMRAVYHTTLPGELDFEAIVIPNDFESFKMPLEGTYLGGIPNTPGFQDHLWHRMEHDKPGHHGLHNAEWGFRVRGYSTTLNLDWSVIFFHTIADDPVTRDMDKFLGWLTGYPGVARIDHPRMPEGIFEYKPYNIFGFSLQHYSPFLKAVLRMEAAYEDNRYYDKGDDIVEKDAISIGLGIDKDLKIPYLYELQGNQAVSLGLELHQLWWRDYDEEVDFSREHPRGDTYDTVLSWSTTLHFFNDTLMPMCRGTYYFTNAGKTTFTLYYKPGQHWSYSLSLSLYWSKRSERTPMVAMEHRDALGFKIAYIF